MATILKIQQKKLNKLQLGLIITILTLALVGGGVYFFIHQQAQRQQAQTAQTADSPENAAAMVRQDRYVEASKLAHSGQYGKAQTSLDNSLKSTQNAAEQSNIYLQKSSLAINNKQPAAALQYALKAESIQPSYTTAGVLGTLYEQAGDKAKALKYYKLVVSRMPDDQKKLAPGNLQYYQDKVSELSK